MTGPEMTLLEDVGQHILPQVEELGYHEGDPALAPDPCELQADLCLS
jgi:hypothetical protein